MFSYSGNAIKAASYSRLSREDGDKIESYSIRNQDVICKGDILPKILHHS